jgi:hypothetical protein
MKTMSQGGYTGWIKSSYSNSSANCVEIATDGHTVGVRDSKQNGDGPVLKFSRAEWAAFLRAGRAGELTR